MPLLEPCGMLDLAPAFCTNSFLCRASWCKNHLRAPFVFTYTGSLRHRLLLFAAMTLTSSVSRFAFLCVYYQAHFPLACHVFACHFFLTAINREENKVILLVTMPLFFCSFSPQLSRSEKAHDGTKKALWLMLK